MYLLALDSTGTQPYIFGSNRLRHNIGASHLVARATGSWALEAVPNPNNVKNAARLTLHESGDHQIEKNNELKAEVLYVGGGNVVALFRGKEQADAFRKTLSRWLLERAPELTLVEAGTPFEWMPVEEKEAAQDAPLSEALDAVLRKLGRKKAARRVPPRPVNRSVTRRGQIYGQPAVAWQDPSPDADEDEDPYPISAEAKAKEVYLDRAHQRLERLLPLPSGYAYPFKLDDLGRAKGEQSFIAVVHADGDRMGKLLQVVARQQPPEDKDPDRAFINRMRALSEEVREAALGAMRDVVSGLHAFIEEHRNGSEDVKLPGVKAPLPLKKNNDGQLLLPLRPIVFGGDDVTFVCDGRLGLALAARYVRRFEVRAEALHLLNSPDLPIVTASAGIAVVKTHYPFSRAYDLAAELTRKAKDKRSKMDPVGSCLDWHLALSDLAGSLDVIRKQYRVADRWLTVRPVAITGGRSDAVDRWNTIRDRVETFREEEYARSKIKQLREKLPQGRKVVASFADEHGLTDLFPDDHPGGYYGNETPYLDVLELMDFAVLDDDLEACNRARTNGKKA